MIYAAASTYKINNQISELYDLVRKKRKNSAVFVTHDHAATSHADAAAEKQRPP